MHPCTYTSQKAKKSKRWLDGFVTVSNKKLVIYNEEKKAVCSAASYRVVDDMIDTPSYLVYAEDPGALLGTAPGPCEERLPDARCAEEPRDPHPAGARAEGRSADDILGLFRRD